MAFNPNRLIFTFNHSDQVAEYGRQVSDFTIVQSNFDSRAQQNLDDINNIKTALQSTATGDSGLRLVGTETITGIMGTNLLELLESLRDNINNVVLGTILDRSLTGVKLELGAVGTDELADTAVTSGKIAVGAVESTNILDNTITGGDIADGVIEDEVYQLGDIRLTSRDLGSDYLLCNNRSFSTSTYASYVPLAPRNNLNTGTSAGSIITLQSNELFRDIQYFSEGLTNPTWVALTNDRIFYAESKNPPTTWTELTSAVSGITSINLRAIAYNNDGRFVVIAGNAVIYTRSGTSINGAFTERTGLLPDEQQITKIRHLGGRWIVTGRGNARPAIWQNTGLSGGTTYSLVANPGGSVNVNQMCTDVAYDGENYVVTVSNGQILVGITSFNDFDVDTSRSNELTSIIYANNFYVIGEDDGRVFYSTRANMNDWEGYRVGSSSRYPTSIAFINNNFVITSKDSDILWFTDDITSSIREMVNFAGNNVELPLCHAADNGDYIVFIGAPSSTTRRFIRLGSVTPNINITGTTAYVRARL